MLTLAVASSGTSPQIEREMRRPLRRRAGKWPPQERAWHSAQLLQFCQGDANNAILAAVGHNFLLLIK